LGDTQVQGGLAKQYIVQTFVSAMRLQTLRCRRGAKHGGRRTNQDISGGKRVTRNMEIQRRLG